MSGISVGPRQFQWMTTRVTGSSSTDERDLHGWNSIATVGAGNAYYYESKLDLRAFNDGNAGNALALLNVAVQESGPLTGYTTNESKPAYTTIVDLISTVKIPPERISSMWTDGPDNLELQAPSFFSNYSPTNVPYDAPINRQYNTSQIIYGKWRLFLTSRDKTGAANKMMLVQTQGGEFGSGEVITAPHAYYYRIFVIADDSHSVFCPQANCSAHATVVDLPEYVELAQMARLGQR